MPFNSTKEALEDFHLIICVSVEQVQKLSTEMIAVFLSQLTQTVLCEVLAAEELPEEYTHSFLQAFVGTWTPGAGVCCRQKAFD